MITNVYIAIKHNFITFTKTPAALILAILPVIMLFVFGFIYPVTNILPHVITISIITVSFSFVGIQFIEYRQNRFFRTNKSISMPNSNFILGTFITLLIILTISTLTLLNIAWFFSSPIPILQQTVDNVYFEELDPIKHIISGQEFFSGFEVSNINPFKFIYSMLVSIVMTSLFAIMIGSIFKSVKSYTVLTLSYLILYIVLGGLAIPYNIIHKSAALTFLSEMIPNTHTNNLLSASMNEGHVIDAYQYINYTEAVQVWATEVVEKFNDGLLFPEVSPNPDGGFGWIVNDIKDPNGVINSAFEEMGMPDIEEGWLDPLKSSLISSAFPWFNGFIQTASELLGFLGIQLEPDVISISKFFYVATYLTDNSTDYGQLQVGFAEMISTVYYLYGSIGDSLELMIRPNPFAITERYGLATNLIPLIVIILTLPNFIIIGREE